MTDVVSIKTGKLIPKPPRQKNSQDAKRWRYLLEKLESGEYVLSLSGLDLFKAGYLDATIDQLDDEILKIERLQKSEREKKRRKRK